MASLDPAFPSPQDAAAEREIEAFIKEVGASIDAVISLARNSDGASQTGDAPAKALEASLNMSVGRLLGSAPALASRIAEKRAVKAAEAIRGMDAAQREYAERVDDYNKMAKEMDPDLFADIEDYGKKSVVMDGSPIVLTAPQATARVLDTRIADPKLDLLRARMAELSQKPELLKARQRIGGAASHYTQNADYLTEIHKTAGKPRNAREAAGASHALGKISAAMERRFAEPVRGMSPLAADMPSPAPQPMGASMRAASDQMKKAGADLIQSIDSTFEKDFGALKPK